MSRRQVARRLGWGMGDQVLSSATNFALTVAVARTVSPASFGAFATLLVASQLAIVLSRALATDPLMVRHSADGGGLRFADDQVGRGALGAPLLLGFIGTLAFAAPALLLPDHLRLTVLVFAAVLPGILLQDAVRFLAITAGRPRTAFVNDMLWGVLQIGGVAAAAQAGATTAAPMVAIWGASGTLCAVLGLAQVGTRPGVVVGARWVRRNWDLSRFYVVENAALNGTNLLNIALIGAVAGLEATASLRGAVALFGPIAVLSIGARAAFTPELVRLSRRDRGALYRWSMALSLGMTAVGVVWAGLLLALPDAWGRAVLGETWAHTDDVLVYMAIDSAVTQFTIGAFIGIRASGQARRGMYARLTLVPVRLALGVGGAAVGGAVGAAVAFACMAPLYVLVWSYHLRRAVRETPRDGDPVPGPAE